jgi:CRP/FNR family transcriptional regulator, anaerobic regulatory protein
MTAKELAKIFPSLESNLLEEICRVRQIKEIPEGEVLMRTGQNIRSTILVLDGLVKIYRQDLEGGEFFMYYLEAGKACAISLVCALGTETSGLAGKAVTPSTVLSIPLQYVDEWMGKYKSWAQFAVSSYRERFDELLQTIDHIAFRNMDERLVFYLKRHQEKTGSNRIATSFTDIAQDLNSSREVISRLMKKLSDRGAVTLYKTHVEIQNLTTALA